MNKIAILGPGKSSLDFKPQEDYKTMAFQEVFPHCVEHLGVVPNYWIGGDPNSYITGFKYLLENKDSLQDANIDILIPNVFFEDQSSYRKSFGTTPIIRRENGWNMFQGLIRDVSKAYKVTKVPVVTTKYLKLHEKKSSELKTIFSEGSEFIRFMSDKVVFGTVEFDSETVSGLRYKWGLENKLTSNVLPTCFFLGAKKVKIYGFDFQGPRFYSEIARHPWNDETQSGNETLEFSLKILKTWVEWKSIHGMEIITGTKDSVSLPSRFLRYEQ